MSAAADEIEVAEDAVAIKGRELAGRSATGKHAIGVGPAVGSGRSAAKIPVITDVHLGAKSLGTARSTRPAPAAANAPVIGRAPLTARPAVTAKAPPVPATPPMTARPAVTAKAPTTGRPLVVAKAPVIEKTPLTENAPLILKGPARADAIGAPKSLLATRVHQDAKVAAATSPHLHWPLVWTVVIVGLFAWGYLAHLERYITPKRGIGYWLGIVGGSMMLLLLLYSARKRVSWLRWMGAIPAWFEFHMLLGIVGPILVVFHSNFKLGATNSDVALICMLLVAGSGVVGRYIYTRLHARLDGNEDSLEELKAVGDRLREQRTSIGFLPGLLGAIEHAEQRYIKPPKGVIAGFLHLSTGAARIALARWSVRREIKQAVDKAHRRESPLVARHAQRLAEVASRYADRRLDAGRRVHEYRVYERLFSLWHVLHIPLFFMLLLAGIAHVIAVNVY